MDSLLPHEMSGMLVLGQHALNRIHTLLQMLLRRAERQPDKVVARRVEQVSLQRNVVMRSAAGHCWKPAILPSLKD